MKTGKQLLANFKRINFSTKSDKQAKELLIKHYENIGRKPPKYILMGHLTLSKINNAKRTITNAYNKQIKKESNIIYEYRKTVKVYNQKMRRYNKKFLEGKSYLQKRYLEGKEIFLPQLSYSGRGMVSNNLTYELIHGEEFSSINAMKERTKQLKQDMEKLENIKPSDLYNVKANYETLKFANDRLIEFQADKEQTKHMINLYNSMTPFEREIAMKLSLETIIERYLGESAPPLTSEREDRFFELMQRYMVGTKNIVKHITDENQYNYTKM